MRTPLGVAGHFAFLWSVPHGGLLVSDLERSLAFYTAAGYTVAGTVEGTAPGSLTVLRLPATASSPSS